MGSLCASLQALVSVAEESEDGGVEAVDARGRRLATTSTKTMTYAVSSDGRERVGTLRRELEHVKTTMTSLLTNAALEAALVKNPKFDVGKALAAAPRGEETLGQTVLNLSWDTSYVFDTYRSIGLGEDTRVTARAAIVDALKEVPKPFAGALFDEASRVATYAKPAANRPAHISPKDVITLMNFVRVILRPDEGASDRATDRAEAFERVCLPEFNSDGFMYVYASTVSTTPSASPASTPTTTPSKKNKRKSCGGPFERDDTVGVCFVVASADALDACRRARDALECSLNEKDALSKIARAAREGLLLDKLPSEVLGEFQASVKQLLHVVYNRPERHQHVSTAFNASVKDADVEAITRAYASTLDAMKETEGIVDHTVSPSFEGSKQRVRYERRSRFNVLACVGGDFEIYLILKPTVTTRAAVGLCNRLCVWLRVSEPELFVDVRA